MLSLLFIASSGYAQDHPPGRVARISSLNGNVSFLPAGQDQWSQATLNFVVTTGDRIYTDKDAKAELDAQLGWIGERVGKQNYRGCPQINVAAEFPEADHPARKVAKAHKRELRRRLKVIAERLKVGATDELAGQLAVLINGAFVSTQLFEPGEATPLLRHAAEALTAAAGRKRQS